MFKKTIKRFISNQIIKPISNNLDSQSDKYRLIVKGARINNKTFSEFKNYCNGKKVVICGAGPSLASYKPIKGAIHIALNRAIIFDKVHFDFLFVQDFKGITTNKLEFFIKNYPNCIKFFEQEGYFRHKGDRCCNESFLNSCLNARPYHSDYLIHNNDCDGYHRDIRFVKDIDNDLLGAFPYVGLTVLQFALFLNPTDIYLVGYDGCGTHFTHINQNDDPIYLENRAKGFENYVQTYLFYWKIFNEFSQNYYPETKIHSINPIKLKGLFDDIYQ